MKIFLDTTDITAIAQLSETGLVDGITTNPSLVAKSGQNFEVLLREICTLIKGPVSAEVTAPDHATMLKEAFHLAKIAPNIVIKVPMTQEGLKTCKVLSDQNIMVNVTLCFSALQALLAAKAGATFISPFVGRLDDIGLDGLDLIADIREIYDNYPAFKTEILVASIRNPAHVLASAKLGADVVTIPPDIFSKMFKHPLTDIGLDIFEKDWEKTKQQILKA
ncbi:MAG: fructose-6-phosphate aldolase [Alphaproteobacteria bacterium 16-39-46]|nr:MAG: fructose-6-phosphate aldolase [Alphaproteobacteria bacterium 16-39-46]OZA43122.1 MAG: fructose-6-phosphate aldolase [Alphaproteobacteria bacterium 17-39-52]HQS84023.1 fructose-6-phosphate aldolase [Alphaproteobacteria bacterium]HQS93634.1 fructose-6-phosphate aldolase [Alphaproteobacteria bacterium]